MISRPGVTHAILLEGINDLNIPNVFGLPEQHVTAEQVIGGYQQLIQRAHSAGIKIVGSTLLPFKTWLFHTEEADAKRQIINEWIRNSDSFDGYVDFDKTMQDPENPLQLLPLYDSGDGLHPSDTGYLAMANAIDLSLLGVSDASTGEPVSAARYDDHQGEIFWDRQGYNRFLIYRDGELLTPAANEGNSFYQDTLLVGQTYSYQVNGVDSEGNETTVGLVTMPGSAVVTVQ